MGITFDYKGVARKSSLTVLEQVCILMYPDWVGGYMDLYLRSNCTELHTHARARVHTQLHVKPGEN